MTYFILAPFIIKVDVSRSVTGQWQVHLRVSRDSTGHLGVG